VGYTINEDGTVTRDRVPNSQNTSSGSNYNGGSSNNSGNDDNNGCLIWIVIAVIVGIIIAVANSNNSTSNNDYEAADSTVCDTVEYYYADTVAADYSYNDSYLSVSPSSVSFDSNGGSRTLSVSSSDSWRISTNTYDWGHLSKSGNSLILRVDANNSSESRTDYFEITSGSKTYRVNISQSGMRQVYLNVNPTSTSFSSSGGSQTIYIDTNTDWNISVNTNSWGHLTKNGNQLTLRVDANSSTSQRTDYFCIKAGSIEKRINITQSGSSSNSYNSTSSRVSGSIRNIWIDHNVSDSYGNKGMRIHVKFDINGMLNRTGQAAAYFYYANGNPLRDTNGSNRTSDGNVATHVNFTPNYENCTFNDLSIFMPYTELHLSQTTSCYFTISIWNGNTEVAQSGTNSFQITF